MARRAYASAAYVAHHSGMISPGRVPLGGWRRDACLTRCAERPAGIARHVVRALRQHVAEKAAETRAPR